MKKVILKTLGYTAAIGAALFLTSDLAFADDLNTVTSNVKNQMPGVSDMLSAISYIAGIGIGIKGGLKLKEHNETKGQVPLSTPITMFVVAGLLIALPSLLGVAKGTIFGTGSTSTTLDGGTLRSIN